MSGSSTPLICPRCARSYSLDQNLCDKCGLPLVYSGSEGESVEKTASQQGKIRPEYRQGDLVKVGWARNQAEAEMIQLMLMEEGIPTALRRSAGFDVPDFLAAGPRDVMAPASAREAARALLEGAELNDKSSESEDYSRGRVLRLLFGVFGALAICAAVLWVLAERL